MYFHHVSSCFIFCSLVEWCEELRREGISVAVEEFGAEGIAELEEKSWGVLPDPWILECQDAENLTFLEYLTPYLVHPRWFPCLVQFFAEEKQLLYGRPRTKFQGFQINVFDRRLAARKSRKEDKKIPYLLNFLGNAGDPLLQRRCGGKDRSRQG